MTTIYIPDPVESLMPFAAERAVAEAAGAELLLGDEQNPTIRDAEVILTTWIRFPAEEIRKFERCRLIVRYGIGVDTIDLDAATECGIVVANAPNHCVAEVADHSAALILSSLRRVPWFNQQVRAGSWRAAQRAEKSMPRLASQTLGLIGLGKIGRQLLKRMVPFGFRIIGYDPYLSEEAIRALGVEPVTFTQLLREADIVSLHVPLMPTTRHLINAEALALMKPTATIVNSSRGGVIDEAALIQALQEGRLFGAALDVLQQEPPAPDNPLLSFDPYRVIITPHAAASSDEVLDDLHAEVALAAGALLSGRWPPSVMNPGVKPKQPLLPYRS